MSHFRPLSGVPSPLRTAVDHVVSFPSSSVVGFVVASLMGASSVSSLTVTGTVSDALEETPLSLANVVLTGTGFGASSDPRGVFVIRGVPAGEYILRVSYVGYATLTRSITVSDALAPLELPLVPTVITLPEYNVNEARELRTEATPESKHGMTTEELDKSLADDVEDVLKLKPGLIAKGDDLHVRGGRADELDLRVNDVSVIDPLTGARRSSASCPSPTPS